MHVTTQQVAMESQQQVTMEKFSTLSITEPSNQPSNSLDNQEEVVTPVAVATSHDIDNDNDAYVVIETPNSVSIETNQPTESSTEMDESTEVTSECKEVTGCTEVTEASEPHLV